MMAYSQAISGFDKSMRILIPFLFLLLAAPMAFAATQSETLELPEPPFPHNEVYSEANLKDGLARAGKGDPAAQYVLGTMYYYGLNVPQDARKAALWFAKAAENGDPNGQVAMGRMYKRGQGVAVDYARALDLFNKSAKNKNAIAYYELGLMYEEGQTPEGRGVFQNLERALKFFKAAGEGGVPQGYLKAAKYHHQGISVPRDLQKAIEYYSKVADVADEQFKKAYGLLLAQLYIDLGSSEKNQEQAVKWYLKAAEAGDLNAQLIVAKAYLSGHGISVNEQEARRWFEIAAQTDNIDALVNLGYIYANGVGVDIDYTKANIYYTRAAEQGSPEAAWNLGNFYANGYGVTQDAKKAQEWFTRSEKLGRRQQYQVPQ